MFNIHRTINDLRVRRLQKRLKQVNAWSEKVKHYSDEELQNQTVRFKQRLENGQQTLDDLLPEAYAVVREASFRILGMYHKDVQVLGAIVLHDGNIAEMQTGEGKTLTATMPLYLNALVGKPAFLITTNDYLANRDCEEMRPLFEWLGLTVSLGFVDIPDYEYQPGEKRRIYSNDIIYTTNGRLGFDYLIDNLADSQQGKFITELNFAIIDEVDSIILDATQTPLVISGAPRVQSNLFHIVQSFIETLEEETHYELDKTKKEIWLTTDGIQLANHYFNISNLYDDAHFDLVRIINLSLRAQHLFESNMDYFIYNGEVILIDRITGRMLPGTKLQSGLHQAIEAKEDVEISRDMSVMATITFQNLFNLFTKFSGMTATAKLGELEFSDLYGKIVVQIPTAQPIQRLDDKDRVFMTMDQKNEAILNQVKTLRQIGRPVLVITRTAEVAEYFSDQLFQLDIPNNLLIAQNVAKEAEMIAEAGQIGAVTVATSMAGRGTDIKLGPGVEAMGGLAVIINEHMENSRIDKQLRGRAGRQGDLGSSQIYISLEDYLVQRYSDSNLIENQKLQTLHSNQLEESPLFQRRVKRMVKKAQKISEEKGIVARELANEFEKSISIQRELIYQERNRIINMESVDALDLNRLAYDVFKEDIKNMGVIHVRALREYIYKNISFQFKGDLSHINVNNHDEVIQFLMDQFKQQQQYQKENLADPYRFHQFMRKVILKAIDSCWITQVDNLQQLKSSINNRQNGQRNAIFEYHRVSLESFNVMTQRIKKRIVINTCLSMMTLDKEGDMVIHFP
ncbi:accessory Sec system translocase SecA2 [Staphylococcus intermedius]|nr:accessory Sec system translocase SecA2 [Staphylococcus intermedius]PCF79080.1 accessory Sec system translocase SecA2 [Staphylococcus intermedius]